MRIKHLILLAALITGVQTTAFALPTDSQQPIHIQADNADLDNNRGILVYRGNVIITQGSMKVMGHTVTITRNQNGDIDVMTSKGSPAYYEQKPAVDDPVIKSYGSTIQYQVTNKKVILTGNAKVIQKNNVFTGDKIVYDTSRKLISASSKPIGSTSSTGSRINMVLDPPEQKKAQ